MNKRIVLTVFDAAVIFVMALASQWIIFGSYNSQIILLTVEIAVADLVILQFTKFYRQKVSIASLNLGVDLAKGFFPIAVVAFAYTGIVNGFNSPITRYSLLLQCSSAGAILFTRFMIRLMMQPGSKADKTALVYGAGELGQVMARQCSKNRFDYRIVGFIDDNPDLQKRVVLDYPVLGTSDNLDKVLSDNPKLDALIIAITHLGSDKMQKAVETAKSHHLEVKIVPNLFETKGSADVSVRDIDYADLLGRHLITVDKKPVEEMLTGKTVLVTGAGGSIGSEICNQINRYSVKKLVVLDIDETELHDLCLRLLDYQKEWSDFIVPVVCDIRNKEKVQRIFDTYKPDIVFHAAAYKHVPLMELYPEEAIINNICGSYNIFQAAANSKVNRVVVISTDKAVNPTNVMGATKRVVEMMAATFNKYSTTDFCCVRFGNVIGSRGSMLPLFLEQIKAGKPITVTDRNIIRYFMAIPEAVSLVFRAATLAQGGEVMVLDMGNPVNIYDFASKLINVFGDGRSTIKITGLRPGEKLYEELLANKDNTIPTVNEKIFKAKVDDSEFTQNSLKTFVDNLSSQTPEQLVNTIKQTVPEFKHD